MKILFSLMLMVLMNQSIAADKKTTNPPSEWRNVQIQGYGETECKKYAAWTAMMIADLDAAQRDEELVEGIQGINMWLAGFSAGAESIMIVLVAELEKGTSEVNKNNRVNPADIMNETYRICKFRPDWRVYDAAVQAYVGKKVKSLKGAH